MPVAFLFWRLEVGMKERRMFFLLLCAMLPAGTGCARRHASLPDMSIPVRCASEITLLQCDTGVQPPKCKSARVSYRRGCEEIVVGRK